MLFLDWLAAILEPSWLLELTNCYETNQIHNSIAKESAIPSSPIASSSTGLIPRRERSPTTPNVIFGRVVSILARLIVGARKSIWNQPNRQFDSQEVVESLPLGGCKLDKHDAEKRTLAHIIKCYFWLNGIHSTKALRNKHVSWELLARRRRHHSIISAIAIRE